MLNFFDNYNMPESERMNSNKIAKQRANNYELLPTCIILNGRSGIINKILFYKIDINNNVLKTIKQNSAILEYDSVLDVLKNSGTVYQNMLEYGRYFIKIFTPSFIYRSENFEVTIARQVGLELESGEGLGLISGALLALNE